MVDFDPRTSADLDPGKEQPALVHSPFDSEKCKRLQRKPGHLHYICRRLVCVRQDLNELVTLRANNLPLITKMAAIATKEAVHSPNVALLKEPTSTHLEYTGPYKHPSQPLRTPRPLRIIVVGAGVSGIAAVKLFRETFPNGDVELVLYEKNADVTGTWLENRYPG